MMLLKNNLMKTEDQLFRGSQETSAEMTTLILVQYESCRFNSSLLNLKSILTMPSHSRTPWITNCEQFVYLLP